jgi:hypothetical protein
VNTSFTIQAPEITIGRIYAAKSPTGKFKRIKITRKAHTWTNVVAQGKKRIRKSYYSIVSTTSGRVFRIQGGGVADMRAKSRGKTVRLDAIMREIVDIKHVSPVISQYLEFESWVFANLGLQLSNYVIPIYTDVIRRPYLGDRLKTKSARRIYQTYKDRYRASLNSEAFEGFEIFQDDVETSIDAATFKFWRQFGPGSVWGPPKFTKIKGSIQFYGVYLTRRPSISNPRGADLRVYIRRRFVKLSDLGDFRRKKIYSPQMREKLLEKLDILGGFQKKRMRAEEPDRSDTFLGVFGWNFVKESR